MRAVNPFGSCFIILTPSPLGAGGHLISQALCACLFVFKQISAVLKHFWLTFVLNTKHLGHFEIERLRSKIIQHNQYYQRPPNWNSDRRIRQRMGNFVAKIIIPSVAYLRQRDGFEKTFP